MKSGWSVPGWPSPCCFPPPHRPHPRWTPPIRQRTRCTSTCISIRSSPGTERADGGNPAAQLRALGYEVTEHVGGTGLVAVLRNGAGHTVMLRTELDALPVEEKTGLPFASKVHAKDPAGRDVAGRPHVRARPAHERAGRDRRHHGAQQATLGTAR